MGKRAAHLTGTSLAKLESWLVRHVRFSGGARMITETADAICGPPQRRPRHSGIW